MKIVHLTSVHSTFDIRIFYKQAISLVNAGHRVTLISTSENQLPDSYRGVELIRVKKYKNKFLRITITCLAIIRKAYKTKADIYHFHDPELIPWCMILHLFGKKIVMDVHEDYKSQIRGNSWIPRILKPLFSYLINLLEWLAVNTFYGIVTVDEPITEKLLKHNAKIKIITVRNYPIINKNTLSFVPTLSKYSSKKILFLGGLMSSRCAPEFIHALEILEDLEYSAYVGGNYNQEEILNLLMNSPIHNRVTFLGRVALEDIEKLLFDSSVSVNLFSNHPNHYGLRSNRLFESLAAALPVIVSNFLLTKSFVDEYSCGIAVDPHSPESIAQALRTLLSNPEIAMEKGLKGRSAVLKHYSWDSQAEKLNKFY